MVNLMPTKITVLNPTVSPSTEKGKLATRPDSLRGKALGCFWNNKGAGERLLTGLAQRLTEKYELSQVIHRKKQWMGESAPKETLLELASSCDVVIGALGD